MNYMEFIYAILMFMLCVIFIHYIQSYIDSLIYMKYVFEATRRASCLDNSTGSLVVAMCIRLTYNGIINVEFYNVTHS